MKKIVFPLIFLGFFANAQEQTADYSTNVQSLESTLKTLYAVISGEKGEVRNWELFKYLFHPDANLIPSGKTKKG